MQVAEECSRNNRRVTKHWPSQTENVAEPPIPVSQAAPSAPHIFEPLLESLYELSSYGLIKPSDDGYVGQPPAARLDQPKCVPAMYPVKEPATESKWQSAASQLQCVECHGPIQYQSPQALSCAVCLRNFPIDRNVLRLNTQYQGNNAIAAEYYNSPLWPKFRFWEWVSYLPRGGERRARNEVMRHLPNLSGTRLLEVAIGDGRNMPLIPPDCHVFGVDISSVLLEKCQRDYAGRNMHLIVGEAESLPFPSSSFDNLLSVGAINHVNDPGKALHEMARVVKSDGIVVVADEVPDLPNRQFAHKLGLPKLQKWILSRIFFLGPMSDVILEHTDLRIEPLVDVALRDWRIHQIWGRLGYCVVGRPK
jgi:SAM-dependent methyltransferase